MTTDRPNRAPSTIWTLRRDRNTPYVATAPDDRIVFADGYGEALNMTRADARLLAKRINQCLDETRKR